MTTTPERLAEIRALIDTELERHPIGAAPAIVSAALELLQVIDHDYVLCNHPETEVVNEGYSHGFGQDIYRRCLACKAIVGSGYKAPSA